MMDDDVSDYASDDDKDDDDDDDDDFINVYMRKASFLCL
jgi:hypothetical protein